MISMLHLLAMTHYCDEISTLEDLLHLCPLYISYGICFTYFSLGLRPFVCFNKINITYQKKKKRSKVFFFFFFILSEITLRSNTMRTTKHSY
jgi:hypothetical protein